MLTKKPNAPSLKRTAVAEVTRARVILSLAEESEDRPGTFRWKELPWPEAESIEDRLLLDVVSLTAMLKGFAAEEKLQGESLRVVLGGDFCVTRVVAGTNEQVAKEMRNLEQRSSLYLSLGHGPKTIAKSLNPIDAKRSQGAMTIVNDDVLTGLVQAVKDAGLKTAVVEHSLVALSRAVGQAGRDAEAPIIVIEFNRRGVDMGVSYQGRLLLDYRPGGTDRDQKKTAETVMKHLGRIQRYCYRHFPFASGTIRKVILCGKSEEVEFLRGHFDQLGYLEAEVLDPQVICPDWKLDRLGAEDSWIVPSVGAVMPAKPHGAPDLMEPMRSAAREPLIPGLIKHAWPIAAALLLTLGLYSAGFVEYGRSSALAARAKKTQENAELLKVRQMELTNLDARTKSMKVVLGSLSRPQWQTFLEEVCGCLPEGAWLEGCKVERNGEVTLSGQCFSEDSVYQFVEDLKSFPMLTNVALEGTRSARLQGGPATLFDIKAEYVVPADSDKKGE